MLYLFIFWAQFISCTGKIPELPKETLDRVFTYLDHVLKKALDPDQQALLNEALDISNINAVVESFGGSGEKAEASSRLIHRSTVVLISLFLPLLWRKFTTVYMSKTEVI